MTIRRKVISAWTREPLAPSARGGTRGGVEQAALHQSDRAALWQTAASGSGVSAAQIAGLIEPGDRIDDTLAVRSRHISEFAARLRIDEIHMPARHAHAVAGHEGGASRETGEKLRTERNGIDRRMRQPHARRASTDYLGDLGQKGAQGHVLSAKNIALADLSSLQRRHVPGGDVVDMDEIEPGIDECGHSPRRRLDDDVAGRGGPHIRGPIGVDGLTITTGS